MDSAPTAFACPHCHELGITEQSRCRSSRGWPAICRFCGKLSYNGSGILHIVVGLYASTIVPAATLFSWFVGQHVLACAIFLSALWAGFVVNRVANPEVMRPVTPAQRDVSRILTYAALLVFVALILAAFIYALHIHKAT